jgi:short-subunit dehydrogenase
MKNIVIVGASRGLGGAFASSLIGPDDRAWLISQNRPALCDGERIRWVEADLAHPGPVLTAALASIDCERVDLLIHNASTWESNEFDETSVEELVSILNISLVSAIQIVRELQLPIKRGSGNLIFIGSTCGLENEGAASVAYAAAKFGLRGASSALREHFRQSGVRVTCINPGSMATDLPAGDPSAAQSRYRGRRMPVDDLVATVRYIMSLSPAACVKELHLPATLDTDV